MAKVAQAIATVTNPEVGLLARIIAGATLVKTGAGAIGGKGGDSTPAPPEMMVMMGEGSDGIVGEGVKNDIIKFGEKAGQCIADNFGLGAAGAALTAAGQPIPGTKPFVTPGSSRGTSLAGKTADLIFGDQKLPRSVKTIVGGFGTGTPLRVSSTRSVARLAGRAVPYVGQVLLAIDLVKIGICAHE